MINLDTTTKSLELILSGVIATNQLPFVISYVDVLSSDQSVSTISSNDGTSNSTTAVTLVAAPAAGHTRTVKEFTIQNADTVSATVTIRLNNSGTFRTIYTTSLSVNDSLQYADGEFTVGVTFPISVPNGGTGDVTLTAHGVLIGEGTSAVAVTAAGAANTVLHGNGAADPTFSAVVNADIANGTIDLTAKVAGTLPVANGGTALASGTSGGVLAFTAPGTLASSAALASTALVIGGGAGAVPKTDANWTIEQAGHSLSSSTQPRAQVFNSAVQSVTNGAFVTLTFDTDDYNVGAMHSTSVNTSRLTVPAGGDGLYIVIGSSRVSPSASTQTALQILKNATTPLRVNTIVQSTSVSNDFLVTWVGNLVAGDFVELQAFQNSAGAINFGSTAKQVANTLSAVKLW